MFRSQFAPLFTAALVLAGSAVAQIVPPADAAPPAGVPAPPAGVPAPPAAAPSDAPALPQGFKTALSLEDVKTAFTALGLQVEQKTAPNGMFYFEARNGGDLIYGTAVRCAGAGQTDCETLVLESGQMNRPVSYEMLTRFNTSGFASRVVTYDLAKREPSLVSITTIHGAFDGTFVPGAVRGLMDDMTVFSTQMQAQPPANGSGFSATEPDARVTGVYVGAASGMLQLSPEAK